MRKTLAAGVVVLLILLLAPAAYANWTGGHDVVGLNGAAPTFYFAEGTCRPNFDPYICIQNPNAADANVTITYMKGDGSTPSQSLTVPAHSRSTVNVKDVLGEGDDAAHDFSTKVASDRPIIAERPMYFNYKGVWTGGSNVVGATSPSSAFYFAEGTCRPNFDSYFCIQNPGPTDAAVTITYMKGDGSTQAQPVSVGAHSRSTVSVNNVLGIGDDISHDFSAKVECTNGQQIIAERPMYFNYKSVWTGGHDVLGATSPQNTFYFAEGTCRPNFDPYLCIQNPGSTPVTVEITYMKGDGTVAALTLTVANHSRSTIRPSDTIGVGDDTAHDFSTKVECKTNGGTIIAERPMYFNYNGVWTGGSDVVGALTPSSDFYFAEGTCRPGFDPYLCIQNPGSKDATVAITYMKGDGSTPSQSLNVPAHSRSTVKVKDVLGEGNDAAHDFSAKVVCTNGQSIIAERPMYFDYYHAYPAPQPTPTPTPTPQPTYTYDFQGTGNQATALFGLKSGLTTFDLTYNTADSNFIVWLKDQQGNDVELLANVITTYNGGRVISVPSDNNYLLNITASGPWTAHIEQPRPGSAPGVPQTYQGSSDGHTGFFTLNGGAARFDMGYQGDSNFIIWLYRSDGTQVELLENEIGNRNDSNTAQVTSGIYTMDVQGQGSWSVIVSQ